MKTRNPYTFTVLRYRHDAISGEQVNVGVVLFSLENREILFRFSKKYGRLRTVFPDLDGHSFAKSLGGLQDSMKALSKQFSLHLSKDFSNSQQFAREVLQFDDSSFQWSEMGSGVTKDIEVELEVLFKRFVSWHEGINSSRRDDNDIWRPVREQLSALQIYGKLKKSVIKSDLTKVTFDHTFQNGRLHCYQPLSFDLSTEQHIHDKVAKWAGHLFHLQAADEELVPYFIVGEASNEKFKSAVDSAVEALEKSPLSPKVFRERDTDVFINSIEDVVRSHDSQKRISLTQ